MIASLSGELQSIRDNRLIINVGGVGFAVHVPANLLLGLTLGQAIEIHTHTYVRENELALYGFRTLEDMELFELLLGVSGIGPRTALAVLSTFNSNELGQAIANEDLTTLTRIPGIGRKTAQRLVLDLKDKLHAQSTAPLAAISSSDTEVINALTALGYSVAEATSAVAAISRDLALDERILAALRSLGT